QHPLKPIVNKIIENRELIVLNSHAHWDHVLGNHQFEKIYIHKSETQFINKKYNLSFLQDSPLESIKKYRKYDFYIPPAKNIIGIADGFTFNLGGTNIKVIHMPGHSPGSVCLLKDQQAIFTTDVAYYGDIFLPSRDLFTPVLESLENLMNMCKNYDDIILYPSHSKTPCDINLVKHLYKEINKIDEKWGNKKSRSFFNAWEIKSDHFNFIIGK
ncbi:MAG: MBL fold metallo-hydrolase, partial [Candidatus Lokiarchaeota archaeon]|nr:MBL fold metallo-hydrolase [Candidatus Lokiarchaeota archaeon]MBD3201390.1 MBL fold metallo-hydrolase [Candidatus Lokiarchaeota archaeon]